MNTPYSSWLEQVKTAQQEKYPLKIVGAGSKDFYGGEIVGKPLKMATNRGIIDYDPAELVVVVRSGTSLKSIQNALAGKGQMLGFEPPFAQAGATIGGVVAAGLSGSGRPYRGGVRDYLLGTKLINGKAEVLQFGGRVMKNVAGFDLFRPMAGAMGTLGVLLEVSLRVIPMPETELTLSFHLPEQGDAINVMSAYGKMLASISAAAWYDDQLTIRLSGSALAVKRDRRLLAKQYALQEANETIWEQLSHFSHPFFQGSENEPNMMVINLPPATGPVDLSGTQFIDWGGARRYLSTASDIATIRAQVQPFGGNVIGLNCADRTAFFQPLSPGLWALNKRLKQTFDPAYILNPGRLYPDL